MTRPILMIKHALKKTFMRMHIPKLRPRTLLRPTTKIRLRPNFSVFHMYPNFWEMFVPTLDTVIFLIPPL